VEYSLSGAVNAPSEIVWNVLVDIERWPDITESFHEVRRLDFGPLAVGSEALVMQPRLPTARWRVTELDPQTGFVWEAKAGGVKSIGAHFVESRKGGSIVTLRLSQRGLLVGLTDLFVGDRVRKYLAMELEGFRRSAESVST
jgi:uncharacterized membrane protein